MQTFQQYFYENKTILSHIMESRSGKWDIFIKFASSFEVLSSSIRFFAKFGSHFVSYLFGKPLAYRRRAAGIVGADSIDKVADLFERTQQFVRQICQMKSWNILNVYLNPLKKKKIITDKEMSRKKTVRRKCSCFLVNCQQMQLNSLR